MKFLPLLFFPLSLSASSPYISKVYEFMPAPGQFVNEIPEFLDGDSYEEVLALTEESLCGAPNAGLVSLGSFGGYIVFGFDHPVVNRHGYYDFKINGNAIISDTDRNGGSSEPGIVMVSADVNGNGLPDDPWYELAGSDYKKETTRHNVTVTYRRPDPHKTPVKDPVRKYITDAEYIAWTADDGTSGYVESNSSHTQSYWPGWLADRDNLSFTGTMLAPNGISLDDKGTNYLLMTLDWGYADNKPNNALHGFNIDWAVDASGKQVLLTQIDFIKVYTGVLQQCGWLGEVSSEIAGAQDLHPDYAYVPEWPGTPEDPHAENPFATIGAIKSDTDPCIKVKAMGRSHITVESNQGGIAQICTIDGRIAATINLAPGESRHDISSLPSGVYILCAGTTCVKLAL